MLTNRQQLILLAIIRDYIDSGIAVGSKRLLSKLGLTISTATIRNEMVVLEKQGLIEKEHISSGRIPSQSGYRYYVDNLMIDLRINKKIDQTLKKVFNLKLQQADDLIYKMVNEMAELTGLTVLALKPETIDVRLSGFRLVPLNNNKIIAIIVNSDGQVISQSFKLPLGTNLSELDDMVRYINETLVNNKVRDILLTLSNDLPLKLERIIRNPMAFLQLFGEILNRSISDSVFMGGRLNLLDFSYNKNSNDIKLIYQFLENATSLRNITECKSDDIMVKIGNENNINLLSQYSIVSSKYNISQIGSGVIAIIGPINMKYEEIIELLKSFKKNLIKQLFEYYH